MRRTRVVFIVLALLILVLIPIIAEATPVLNTGGILNSAQAKFQAAAANWSAVLNPAARHLFLGLAVMGLIWNSGFLILGGADIGALFSSFIRWMIFVGFFWWLVQHGTDIASAIVSSFASIGSSAAGVGPDLGPSTPLTIGFQILQKSGDAGHWYQVGDQICMVLVMMVILIAMAVIAANMLITLCTSWLLIYAGQILLGFGAVSWTSDIAINYLRHVLGIAITYMTMLLLVGVCNSVMSDYINSMNANALTWQDLAVIAVVSVVLALLVHKVPPLVGSITGNHGGAHGALGIGSAIAMFSMATAAVAAGGVNAAGSIRNGAPDFGEDSISPLMSAVRDAQAASGQSEDSGTSLDAAMSREAANDADGAEESSLSKSMGKPPEAETQTAPSVGTSKPIAADGNDDGPVQTERGSGAASIPTPAGGFTLSKAVSEAPQTSLDENALDHPKEAGVAFHDNAPDDFDAEIEDFVKKGSVVAESTEVIG